MEKIDYIEGLLNVLEVFGKELRNVKDLVGDIQEEMRRHTDNLKVELFGFKKQLNGGGLSKMILSSEEKEVQQRLSQLRLEVKKLEEIKEHKLKEIAAIDKLNENEFNGSSCNGSNTTPNKKPSRVTFAPIVNTAKTPLISESLLSLESHNPLPKEWWTKRSDIEMDEEIDWAKEHAEREELKTCLMIKEGWKKQNTTFEALEATLRSWTGRLMKWQVLRQGKAKNGKALFNVRFESLEDRQKVFDMRKEIAEEGLLLVGESLTYVERRERWAMLETSEKLAVEGRNVEFENKKICVDGEWWRYDYINGWERV